MADVSSANVVGYSTVNIKAGWLNLISTSFDEVGGTTRPKLNEGFIAGGTEHITPTVEFGSDEADNIMVYMPDLGGYHSDYTFYYCGDVDDEELNFKWLVATDDSPADYAIPAGSSFFYWSRAEKGTENDFQLTFAGQVSAKPVEVSIYPNYLNMLANPYPQGIDINGTQDGLTFDWHSLGAHGTVEFGSDEADNIMIYRPDLGGYHSDYTFYFCDDVDDEELNFKWLLATDDSPVDFVIPAGAGFWYWRRSGEPMTLPFISPIAAK